MVGVNAVKKAYRVTADDIRGIIDAVTDYSLYAYEDEVRQGFVTVCGGHRVGVAGQVVLEHGRVRNVKHISFINIRVSHQIKGCATCLLPYVIKDGRLLHTLIAGMWKDDNLAGAGAADIGWKQLL